MTSNRIRKLVYDFGEYIVEEESAAQQWDAGDPVLDNQETLVVFLHRKNVDDYGID